MLMLLDDAVVDAAAVIFGIKYHAIGGTSFIQIKPSFGSHFWLPFGAAQ